MLAFYGRPPLTYQLLVQDLQVSNAGQTIAAYSWAACVYLAQNGKALYNAENYALYATAVIVLPAVYSSGVKTGVIADDDDDDDDEVMSPM